MLDLIKFGRDINIDASEASQILTFDEGKRTPWNLDFTNDFDFDTKTTSFSKSEIFDSDISTLNRVDLDFDSQAFSYQVKISKNDDEKEPMPSVMNDNIDRYLGFGSLDINEVSNQPGNEILGEQTAKDDDYEEPLEPEETYSGLEELKHLMILWRFDQGAGSKIMDLSENKNHGNILKEGGVVNKENSETYWNAGELEAGQPLTFEDEWGKDNPPNWAITFEGKESIRVRGSKALSGFKGHFTFQIWLKFEEFSEFTLFKRLAEDFNLKIKQPDLVEISRAHSIRNILTFNLSEPLKEGIWNNISITYRQSQPDEDQNDELGLKIYVNSILSFSNPNLNFRKPLNETDGLIFLQDYNGQFTELRFWSINLNQNIIKETLVKPLE
jgi:hypothetical protein